MRQYEDILNNRRLTILTKLNNEEGIQIRANYTDPLTQKTYWCKFTRAYDWEHVTVSSKNKVPPYEVMCAVKDIFWDDEECCIEYHPRKSQYVNNNETCLHIWRPINVELPEPPTILLGLQGMSSSEANASIRLALNMMSDEERIAFGKKIGIKQNRANRRHK